MAELETTPSKISEQSMRDLYSKETRRGSIEWIIRIGLVGGIVTILFDLFLYFQTGANQFLYAIAGVVLALLSFFVSWQFLQQNRLNSAAYMLLSAAMFAYGLPELGWSGATILLALGAVLVIFLVGILTLLNKWRQWFILIILSVAYFWLIDQFWPLSRYDIGQLLSLQIFLVLITSFFVVTFLWQMIRVFSSGNIQTRLLIAFIGIVAATAIVVSLSSLFISFQVGQQNVVQELESQANLQETKIQAWVDNLGAEIFSVLVQPATLTWMQSVLEQDELRQSVGRTILARTLEESRELGNHFDELFVVNLNGEVLISTDPAQVGGSYQDQPFFIEGRLLRCSYCVAGDQPESVEEQKSNFIQAPRYFTEDDQIAMFVAQPIFGRQGELLGVFAGRVNGDRLAEVIQTESESEGSIKTYLVDSDRNLITKVSNDLPVGKTQIDTAGVQHALEQNNGINNYTDYQGNQVIGVYRWLPELKIALLVEQDRTEAFESVFTMLGINVFVAVVALGGAVLAGVAVTRGITKPLRNLAHTSTKVAEGNLSLRAEVERNDEVGEVAHAFNQMAERLRDSINFLEARVKERTVALEKVSDIGVQLSGILTSDELLTYVTNRIQADFNFYHVHIYLVDQETGDLVMAEGSGEIGKQLKEKGHRLEEGKGIVGTVASTNESFMSNNVDEILNFVRNPLLPNTKSELAVPLRKGQSVLGVLDIQSEQPNRFTTEDIDLMQSLANQIASAVENVRLIEETQTALDEVERLNSRLTQQSWEKFKQQLKTTGYRFNRGRSVAITPEADVWLPPMKHALDKKQVVKQSRSANGDNAEAELAVPLMFRGQVIGVLGVKREEVPDWSPEEVAAVESVADQVARALENARLSKEQENTIEQLKEVDRLKSEFLTSMSHELRTPLNSIIGFADVLLQGIDGELNDLATNDIQLIYSSAQHLLALINDILDIAKIESGGLDLVLEPIDISVVVREVMASSSALFKNKPVSVKTDMEENLPPIYADKLRLNQILLNLISNAAKFTDEGSITISASVDEETQDKMVITVTDTGIGIPTNKLEEIFDRFRQADMATTRKYGGTGLGLAISKQLIELHGGEIEVESEIDVGSTFRFTIPLVSEENNVEIESN